MKKTVHLLFCLAGAVLAALPAGLLSADEPFVDKTMVVWASPYSMNQRGGTALTIDMANPDAFDGIVFAELTPNVWMPGSSHYFRTEQNQENWPQADGSFDKVVTVYSGKNVTFYLNDKKIADYTMAGSPQMYDQSATILFGPRHIFNRDDVFVGKIQDARIYPAALTEEQVLALEPGKALDGVEPWVWWNFAETGLYERCGRFNNLQMSGDAKIEDGALVLGLEKGELIAHASGGDAKTPVPEKWDINGPVPGPVLESSRLLREKFLADPYRPHWHFACPEDNGMPGDSNGCFWADGEYHLMYLYNRTGSGFAWGHLTSIDLIHWRHHPDSIGPGGGEDGCFSGGGFLDDDGTAYLTYWIFDNANSSPSGIGMAKSSDPGYNYWTKFGDPVIRSTSDFGVTEVENENGKLIYGSADPSNIWKKDGKYYMLTGNLTVLNKYGRNEDSPEEMRGDRTYLFESADLTNWNYKGVFYQRSKEWTDDSEDDMCPSFLPLPKSADGGEMSDQYLLLFISHNKGCQYYVGTYDKESDRFIPNNHGRMTWVDNTYFAPEALIDGKGRQIMWSWLLDNRDGEFGQSGWSGVYGLPRSLWLGDDGTLRMAPVAELAMLRSHEQTLADQKIAANQPFAVSGFPGDSFEMEITLSPEERAKVGNFGITVRENPKNGEKTTLYYDAVNQTLCYDSTKSGPAGRPALETAPLELPADEPLTLRVFVDQSIIEIYANDRQSICRRSYPTDPAESMGVSIFSDADVSVDSIKTWKMNPSNPY